MIFKPSVLVAALAAVASLAAAPAASAATQTVVGTNFDLTYDDAALGMFGALTLAGNNIIFTPTTFKAESLNGAGVVSANQTINLRLFAHTGFDIGNISLLERGDYRLNGAGSTVMVDGQLRAFGLANPFSELNSFITASSPLTINDTALHNWTATSLLDFAGNPGVVDQSKGVSLTLENLLTATSVAPVSQAFIEKKFAGGAVTLQVSPVPEPETYALMGAGLGVIALVTRRRRPR